MNRKGNFEVGFIVITFALMAIVVVAAMATQTSSVFGSFATSEWGIFGFMIKHFNLVLFLALTLSVFIGVGALRR